MTKKKIRRKVSVISTSLPRMRSPNIPRKKIRKTSTHQNFLSCRQYTNYMRSLKMRLKMRCNFKT